MASRPDVRGGSPTRGFPPGSAQALVALVLGLVLFATGLQRDQLVLSGVFLGIALLGGVALVRLFLRR